MSQTVNEFIATLSQYGEDLRVTTSNSYWEQAIEKVAEDLKDMRITSKRSNKDWGTSGDDLYLEVVDYLLYQNYGVKAAGFSSTAYNLQQTQVDSAWGITPSGGSNFQFGVGKESTNGWGATYSGLNAKRDFSVNGGSYNITEEFTNYFLEIQQQQNNL